MAAAAEKSQKMVCALFIDNKLFKKCVWLLMEMCWLGMPQLCSTNVNWNVFYWEITIWKKNKCKQSLMSYSQKNLCVKFKIKISKSKINK